MFSTISLGTYMYNMYKCYWCILCVKLSHHRSELGVLNQCYPASELERYSGPLTCCVEGWKEEQKVCLREVTKCQAPWNKFIVNSCRCTTGYSTKKCRCVRHRLCCRVNCHGGECCSNKNHDEPQQTGRRKHEKDKLPSPKKFSLSHLGLDCSDVKVLKGWRCLNDKIVNAAQKLLQKQYPHVPGMHNFV